MKKVFTLSFLSLFASVAMVAQSSSAQSNAELKKETKVQPVVKVDKSKMKPVVKVKSVQLNNTVQPVKKEEETKSIETKQK